MKAHATLDAIQDGYGQDATIYRVTIGDYSRRLFMKKDGLLFSHVTQDAPSPAEIKAVQESLDRERATLFAADPALADYFPEITVHA